MIELKNDCIVLEGFVCSGDRSPSSLFCPREAYPIWREAWLRRVDERPVAPRVGLELTSPIRTATAIRRSAGRAQLGVGTTSPTSASRATSDA